MSPHPTMIISRDTSWMEPLIGIKKLLPFGRPPVICKVDGAQEIAMNSDEKPSSQLQIIEKPQPRRRRR